MLAKLGLPGTRERANEFTRLFVCIYSKFMELGARGLSKNMNSKIIIIELKG
jgi:hypothetical protein